MIYVMEFSLPTQVALKDGGTQTRETALARFNHHCGDLEDGGFLE